MLCCLFLWFDIPYHIFGERGVEICWTEWYSGVESKVDTTDLFLSQDTTSEPIHNSLIEEPIESVVLSLSAVWLVLGSAHCCEWDKGDERSSESLVVAARIWVTYADSTISRIALFREKSQNLCLMTADLCGLDPTNFQGLSSYPGSIVDDCEEFIANSLV